MHTNLASHLHTPQCNEMIAALEKCHAEKSFTKFFGACNELDTAVNRCLKKERLAKREANGLSARKAHQARIEKFGK